MGGKTLVVTSQSSDTLTGSAGWVGGTPAAGAYSWAWSPTVSTKKCRYVDDFNDGGPEGSYTSDHITGDTGDEQRFDFADFGGADTAVPIAVILWADLNDSSVLDDAVICADDGTAQSVTKAWSGAAPQHFLLMTQAPTARTWSQDLFDSLQATLTAAVNGAKCYQLVAEVLIDSGSVTQPGSGGQGTTSEPADGTSICPVAAAAFVPRVMVI